MATLKPLDVLRNAVAAAVMAPSSHNTQPWRFQIFEPRLDVLTDPTRHLSVIDPERRQQVQSCGCALFNARVAVRAMGFTPEVTPIHDKDRPHHVASLELGAPHLTTEDDHALMSAIAQRRTNRRAFLPRPVPPPVIDQLVTAAAGEGATLVRLAPEQKHRIAVLIDEADQHQFDNPAFRAELSHWLNPFGSLRRDGIPFVEKEYGSAMPFAMLRALRSPSLGARFGAIEEHLVEGSPVIVAIGTATDGPLDWLACGQALEAVLLRATARGLSAAFLNQVLEVPALRAKVTEIVPGIGHPQMVLRLGVPEDPVHHVAPRRNLDDVLEIVHWT